MIISVDTIIKKVKGVGPSPWKKSKKGPCPKEDIMGEIRLSMGIIKNFWSTKIGRIKIINRASAANPMAREAVRVIFRSFTIESNIIFRNFTMRGFLSCACNLSI
tara:strand:+ start:209 stop:523 length:315 start_codon:yes stop_codon:yes gene_type:complete